MHICNSLHEQSERDRMATYHAEPRTLSEIMHLNMAAAYHKVRIDRKLRNGKRVFECPEDLLQDKDVRSWLIKHYWDKGWIMYLELKKEESTGGAEQKWNLRFVKDEPEKLQRKINAALKGCSGKCEFKWPENIPTDEHTFYAVKNYYSAKGWRVHIRKKKAGNYIVLTKANSRKGKRQ